MVCGYEIVTQVHLKCHLNRSIRLISSVNAQSFKDSLFLVLEKDKMDLVKNYIQKRA